GPVPGPESLEGEPRLEVERVPQLAARVGDAQGVGPVEPGEPKAPAVAVVPFVRAHDRRSQCRGGNTGALAVHAAAIPEAEPRPLAGQEDPEAGDVQPEVGAAVEGRVARVAVALQAAEGLVPRGAHSGRGVDPS